MAINIDNSRLVLSHYRRILTILANIVGATVGKSYVGPYLHRAAQAVSKKHRGKDKPAIVDFIKKNQPFIKSILDDLRNVDEHPDLTKPFLYDFSLAKDENGNPVLISPRFYNNWDIKETILKMQNSIFEFTEDLIIILLNGNIPDFYVVVNIPEEHRDKDYPERYKLIVNPKVTPGVRNTIIPGFYIRYEDEKGIILETD